MTDQLKVTSSTKIWTSTASKFRNKKFIGRYEFAKGDRIFQLYQIEPQRRDQMPVSYNSWQAAKKDGWSHDRED